MKRSVPPLALALAAVLAAAGTARCEERIVVLKNGHRLRGEIVEETSTSYVLRAKEGGKATIARSEVLRVEAPAAGGKFLESDSRPHPRPAPPAAPAPEAVPEAAPAPVAPVSTAAPAPEWEGAPAPVVSECRAWLAETAALPPEKQAPRQKAALERFGLDGLLGLLARAPVGPDEDPARAQAAAAVRLAGPAGRGPLTRALVGTRARSAELLELVRPLFDASVEDALAAALPGWKPGERVPVYPLLEEHGTLRSTEVLARCIVKGGGDPRFAGHALAAIVRRERNPGTAVAPLVALVASSLRELQAETRLEGVLEPFEASPRDTQGVVASLARGIRATLDSEASQGTRVILTQQLELCYGSLAAMATDESVDELERAIASEVNAERRSRWIRCFKRAAPLAQSRKLVGWLVAHWETHPQDEAAVSWTLVNLTGQPFHNVLGSWKNYVGQLPDDR